MIPYALPGEHRETALTAFTVWIVTRGLLSLFLLMPAIVVLIGYLLRLVPLPAATFGVFLSFTGFTAWVSYRLANSDDPDEPVHHLHRYALYALAPVAMFSLVQIPAYFAADVVYWQLWYDSGMELTREPRTELWSLAAGMLLYTLVGMGLVMSSYVLIRRRRLVMTVVFLGILMPALFLSMFSAYCVTGAQPGLAWYVTFWLAAIVAALTAWALPIVWPQVWRVLRGQAVMALVAASVLLLTVPFAFAVERATNGQSIEQRSIDHAAFERIIMSLHGPLVFAVDADRCGLQRLSALPLAGFGAGLAGLTTRRAMPT